MPLLRVNLDLGDGWGNITIQRQPRVHLAARSSSV